MPLSVATVVMLPEFVPAFYRPIEIREAWAADAQSDAEANTAAMGRSFRMAGRPFGF